MEAAGVGIDLQTGDVAFRCNFVTHGDNNIVIDRLGEQYGYKAAVVAGEDTVLGVGRLSGYDV